jgi:hypothetical protein
MKQLKLSLIFTLAGLLLCACQIPSLQHIVVGSNRMISEDRTVARIQAVEMRGFGRLVISQGDEETLTVEAEDNLIPNLVSEMRGSTLVIREKALFSFKTDRPILFRLTVRSLDSLELNGCTQAEINDLRTNTLKVQLNDFSQLTLNGLDAENFEARISGFSRLDAAGVVDSAAIEMTESAEYTHNGLTIR